MPYLNNKDNSSEVIPFNVYPDIDSCIRTVTSKASSLERLNTISDYNRNCDEISTSFAENLCTIN